MSLYRQLKSKPKTIKKIDPNLNYTSYILTLTQWLNGLFTMSNTTYSYTFD